MFDFYRMLSFYFTTIGFYFSSMVGFLMVLPMVMEIGFEEGFHSAIVDFFTMQLQLASMLFTFQRGTKSHYYGRTILYGGSKYRPTGRGFVVFHAKFAEEVTL
ncbi:hypothetical protein N665_0120s0019 [Sinapis alba]|nr:hypothetical protein N665_0120s0019 [Sinapis alba]